MNFDILNHIRVAHECDRETNRWTDFIIANAAFHYVARPKIGLRLAHDTVNYRERHFSQLKAYEAQSRNTPTRYHSPGKKQQQQGS